MRRRTSIAAALACLLLLTSAAPAAAVHPEEATATPSPSRQPAGHRSQQNGAEISWLRIPAIGVDEVVRSGVDLSVVDRGVGHWVGTAQPGDEGNVVLAGHRSTHTAPFRDLDRLVPGDLIFLMDAAGREVMYRVTETLIVTPDDIWISFEVGRPILTLFACHPKGSERRRIVIRADLIGGGLIV